MLEELATERGAHDVDVLARLSERLPPRLAVPALDHLRAGCPEPEQEATFREQVERRRRHRRQRRRAAGDLHDRAPELDLARGGAKPREHAHAVGSPGLRGPGGVVAEALRLLREGDRLERARPRWCVSHVHPETHSLLPSRIGHECDANAVTITDLRPTDEVQELRARVRAFMEAHVYPNEATLDREDEDADALVQRATRYRKGARTLGAAPAAGSRRLERELPHVCVPERGDRALALGAARCSAARPRMRGTGRSSGSSGRRSRRSAG